MYVLDAPKQRVRRGVVISVLPVHIFLLGCVKYVICGFDRLYMVDTPLCKQHDRLRENGGDGRKSEDVIRGIRVKTNLRKKCLPRRVMSGELVEVKGDTPGGKKTNLWCV